VTPDEALAEIVRIFDLEPMGTQPDGKATWDDAVAYVAKRAGTARSALDTIARRNEWLAEALGVPADTPYRTMVERVRLYRTNVTLGGPPPAIDSTWGNRADPGPPPSAGDAAPEALRQVMRCPAPPQGCGHMFNRHDPDGQGCHVRIEVNHVDGVAQGFDLCGCTERRPR